MLKLEEIKKNAAISGIEPSSMRCFVRGLR